MMEDIKSPEIPESNSILVTMRCRKCNKAELSFAINAAAISTAMGPEAMMLNGTYEAAMWRMLEHWKGNTVGNCKGCSGATSVGEQAAG